MAWLIGQVTNELQVSANCLASNIPQQKPGKTHKSGLPPDSRPWWWSKRRTTASWARPSVRPSRFILSTSPFTFQYHRIHNLISVCIFEALVFYHPLSLSGVLRIVPRSSGFLRDLTDLYTLTWGETWSFCSSSSCPGGWLFSRKPSYSSSLCFFSFPALSHSNPSTYSNFFIIYYIFFLFNHHLHKIYTIHIHRLPIDQSS